MWQSHHGILTQVELHHFLSAFTNVRRVPGISFVMAQTPPDDVARSNAIRHSR